MTVEASESTDERDVGGWYPSRGGTSNPYRQNGSGSSRGSREARYRAGRNEACEALAEALARIEQSRLVWSCR